MVEAVKSSLGHAEPGAGITSLARTHACMCLRVAAPLTQLRQLSAHLGSILGREAGAEWSPHTAILPKSSMGSACPTDAQLTGSGWLGRVSVFAFQGTDAHVLLQPALWHRLHRPAAATGRPHSCSRERVCTVCWNRRLR